MKVKELLVESFNAFSNLFCKNGHTILLGNHTEGHHFHAFTVCFENREVNIGVSSHSLIKPCLLIQDKHLLIGFDEEVDVISDITVLRSYHWESPFFRFITTESGNILLVFDSGIICINKEFNLEWNYTGKDMITGCSVSEHGVEVSFLDGTTEILPRSAK